MNESVWKKSSYSGPREPNCVECRTEVGHVLIRDSQHPELGSLAFDPREWRAFLGEVDAL